MIDNVDINKIQKELIEEDEKAEIKCQFCNKTYQFNKEELEGILERAQNK